MKLSGAGKLLRIFIGESDTHNNKPLYEAIVLKARELNLAGASVYRGILGYGTSSRIHTTKLLRLSDDLPITIEIVDTEKNIKQLLPFLRLIRQGLEREDSGQAPSWALAALGGLAVTLLNPTFAQKVVLTAYSDTSVAVTTAFAGVLGWMMLNALSRDDKAEAVRLSWLIGLVFVVLVNVKQASFVLFVIVVFAVMVTGLRDPSVRFRELLRTLPGMTILPLIIYMTWRYYVGQELSGGEFTLRPVSGWFIAELPQIIGRMVLVLSKKGLYLALMLAAGFFAVRAMMRMQSPFDRLAAITGATLFGYNAFLLFTYVAAFGINDALRAASLWRYNMHLGLLAVAFAGYGAAILWRTRAPAGLLKLTPAWLPIILFIAAPFAVAHKLRFDRVQPVPHFRAVAAELPGFLKFGNRLTIFDPDGSGESGVIAHFELSRLGIHSNYLSAFHDNSGATLTKHLAGGNYNFVLVHSIVPGVLEAIGLDLPETGSHLLAPDGAGWKAIKHWPYPEDFPVLKKP